MPVTIRAMSEGTQPMIDGRRGAAGFTLVELLVVLLVGSILLGLGIPAMQGLIADNQMNAVTDNFASALNSARSEAGKLGVPVALSTTGGQNWGSGWTMFVDTNGNGTQDTGQTPAEATVRVGAALPTGYSLKSGPGFSGGIVSFDATGRRVQAGGSANFMICYGNFPAAGAAARLITLTPSGRVRIAQNNAAGQPIDDTGTALTACTPP